MRVYPPSLRGMQIWSRRLRKYQPQADSTQMRAPKVDARSISRMSGESATL